MAGENVVSIVVKADNATGPGFASAKASADGAAGSMDTLAAAQDKVTQAEIALRNAEIQQTDAQLRVEELQQSGSASADELAAAQDKVTTATIRAADAQIRLGEADARVAEASKAAGDASEVQAAKTDAGGGLMAGAGAKVKTAFLGIAVGAGFAIDSAMKYQEQSTQLVTGAGELDKNLKMVQQGMLNISTQTATSTSQVQSGMYMIESAGYHGADGLKVLQAAAEGAKVGNADLGTVADGLTTVLTDYKMPADQAAAATSGLVAVVAAGKTHMADLSSSLSKVLPTASALKVPFDQVGGAMATMTGQGVTARLAATHLNSTLIAMAKPSAAAAKAMEGVGLSSTQVATTLTHQGLTAALQMVTEAAGKKFPVGSAGYIAAVDTMLGGSAGLATALQLTGKHLGDLKKNTDSAAGAMHAGSKDVQGWSKVQDDASFKMEKTEQAAKNTATAFGEALMPAVTDILGPLSSFLGFIARSSAASTAFAAIIGGVLSVYLGSKLVSALSEVKGAGETAFEFIGNIGPKLASFGSGIASAASSVASFVATMVQGFAKAVAATAVWIAEHAVAAAEFVAQNIAMAASAIAAFVAENLATLGIIAAIALLVAAIVYLATHWKQVWGDVKNWALDAWHFLDNDVIHPIANAVSGLVNDVTGFFKRMFSDVTSTVRSGAASVVSFFTGLPGRIASALSSLGSMMFNAGVHAIQSLISGITSMIGSVGSTMSGIASKIAGFIGLSPAKEGPLSGGGAPEIRGAHIAQDIAKGMMSGHGAVATAAQHLAGTAAIGSAGGGGAGGAGAGGAGGVTIQLQAGGGGSGMDQLFMNWLKQTVRVSGGDPRIFNRKVQFQ